MADEREQEEVGVKREGPEAKLGQAEQYHAEIMSKELDLVEVQTGAEELG